MFDYYILLIGQRKDRKQVIMDLTNHCWATTDCGHVEMGIDHLTDGESLSEIDLARNLCKDDVNEECWRISKEFELARMADTSIGRSTIHFRSENLLIDHLSQFPSVTMECQIIDSRRLLLLYFTIDDGKCSAIEEFPPVETQGRIDPRNRNYFFSESMGVSFAKQSRGQNFF